MKRRARISALGTLFVFFALQQQAPAQTEGVRRFEVGGQFSALGLREPASDVKAGFGGRFSVNLTEHMAAEAQLDFYPGRNPGSEFTGGRTTTGLFGVKAGRRFDRFGVYAKARPGFVHFERTLAGFNLVPATPDFPVPIFLAEFKPRTEFATDVGAVLEFYPTRRLVARLDLGDTIIRFKGRTITYPVLDAGTPPMVTLVPFARPAQTKHHFQLSAGVGFRF